MSEPQLSDLLDRQPPDAEWAKRAIDTACRMLCELYGGADRETVFSLAMQLKSDIRNDNRYTDPETGESLGASSTLETLMKCRDTESEEASEQSYRRGYVHGYSSACDDVAASKSIEAMNHHVDTLNDWRTEDCREIVTPPSID